MASASSRMARSRSSLRLSRATSVARASGEPQMSGGVANPVLQHLGANDQIAARVALVHAGGMLDQGFLAELARRAFDEAMRQGAKPAAGIVTDVQRAVGAVREMEM